jgi:hypothetical protein
MQLTASKDIEETEIAKFFETEEDLVILRLQIKDIIEGAAFKGSQRSAQFLQYIVDQAMAGQPQALKERIIGMELFGRAPSYDTGEDAIVRVTASDVRKRLLQHYGKYGSTSEFRISLPLGSYVPKITRALPTLPDANPLDTIEPQHLTAKGGADPVTTPHGLDQPVVSFPADSMAKPLSGKTNSIALWLPLGVILLSMGIVAWSTFRGQPHLSQSVSPSILPWSAFFSSSQPTMLITSDPDIAAIQGITNSQISLSDYANHKYIPERNELNPDIVRFSHDVLRGDKASLVDTPIAVRISELFPRSSKKLDTRGSRSIQFSDLRTDENLIFLGSPRSDPWSSLFSDQLDFKFVWNKELGQEVIANTRPRLHELPLYVPTAIGFATGQSFAIIAFVRNPDGNGQVLLLAGASAEGTEAAGELVTDLPWLTTTLEKCGIAPSGPLQHFELLLRLNTIAGSPNRISVEACHISPRNSD